MKKKSIYILGASLLLLVMILSAATGAATVKFISLEGEEISTFGSGVEGSDVVVDSQNTDIKGKGQVQVTVELNNTVSETRSVKVTVQSLDSSDIELDKVTKRLVLGPLENTNEQFKLLRHGQNATKHDETFIVVEET